ncbi:MAG: hypothetical protein NT148_01850 [Candidatus Nealsonbacteria bacterium]|nr:hypothetical protein [Candidatus Nealsonbacteria bacterium]
MNKRGLIGKIILIVIVLIIAVVAVTAWQIYSLVKVATQETPYLATTIASLTAKGALVNQSDCDSIPQIEASVSKLKSSAESACANPLIATAVNKMQQVAIKCKDVSTLDSQFSTNIAKFFKNYCQNRNAAVNQTGSVCSAINQTCGGGIPGPSGEGHSLSCCASLTCNHNSTSGYSEIGVCI